MTSIITSFGDVADATGYDPAAILQAEGINPATAESAAGSALTLAAGGKVDFGTLAPIIGLALAATGVGAPAAALVTGLLAGFSALAGFLSGGNVQADWYVGADGFKGPKPYGPADPKWVSFEKWLASVGGTSSWLATGAFPWLPTMARDEAQLGTDPASQFQRAFFEAWKRGVAEVRINGYNAPSPYALLVTMAATWNANHQAGAGFDFTTNGAGTWAQVSGTQARDQQTNEYIAAVPPVRVAQGWYIGALLAGEVDGQDHPPVHLNTGAGVFHFVPIKAGPAGSPRFGVTNKPPSSAAKIVALTGGVLATAGALAWLASRVLR